jgi:hypothetical protein
MGVSVVPRGVILGNFATSKQWITQLGGSAGTSLASGAARLVGLPGYRSVNRVEPPTGKPDVAGRLVA